MAQIKDASSVYDLGEELEIFGDAVFKIRSDYPVALAEIHDVGDGGLADLGRVTENILVLCVEEHGLFNERDGHVLTVHVAAAVDSVAADEGIVADGAAVFALAVVVAGDGAQRER